MEELQQIRSVELTLNYPLTIKGYEAGGGVATHPNKFLSPLYFRLTAFFIVTAYTLKTAHLFSLPQTTLKCIRLFVTVLTLECTSVLI